MKRTEICGRPLRQHSSWSRPLWLLGALFAVVTAPGASELKRDERVVFFPTLGWPSRGGWELDIHGCVFEPERSPVLTAILRKALGIDDDGWSAAEKAIWRERSQLFLLDHERGKEMTVRIAGQTHHAGTSGADGHFHACVWIPPSSSRPLPGESNGWIHFQLAEESHPARPAAGRVSLLSATGVSVISDIDDTLKISQVRDRRELLLNTFVRPFQPVPGMADLCQGWASQGAAFHYVSASPWQLYVPLAIFVHSNGFPPGTFHLKDVRLKDETFWDLFASSEQFKSGVIEPLLRRFPKRRFVLLGDSGEKDPEVYAALARRHPGQVLRIFIRDVTGEEADSARYRQVFAGLRRDLWSIFRQPPDIEPALPRNAIEGGADTP